MVFYFVYFRISFRRGIISEIVVIQRQMKPQRKEKQKQIEKIARKKYIITQIAADSFYIQ